MVFFESKRAAAILKHAILAKYLVPFASKTGSTSTNGRVAFVDAYAGEGRYEDGSDGSPALVINQAKKLRDLGRDLLCVFVEQDQVAFGKLEALVAKEAEGIRVELRQGDITERLDEVVGLIADHPALLFLDPFGFMIPFDQASSIWAGRPHSYGTPPIELLVNFNAGALRRTAGLLTSESAVPATLARLDEVCGGQWWRQVWLDNQQDRDRAESLVVSEYARRLAGAGGCGYWITEVRNRSHHKPVYYLIFLTRHHDGQHAYGEAVSLGLQEWRKAVALADYDEDMLITPETVIEHEEAVLASRWVDEIERNLRRLLAGGVGFSIRDRYADVFGRSLGLARDMHLRKAWKKLHAEGLTSTDSKGKLIEKRIEPA